MRGLTDIQYELIVGNDRECSGVGESVGFTPAEDANLRELADRNCVVWCDCGCGSRHPEVTSVGRDARAIHEWLQRETEK